MAKEVSQDTLVDLVESVKTIATETQRRRQKTILEVERGGPFHPPGVKRPKLKWEAVYYNNFKTSPLRMTPAELEGVNKLKPGRYLDRRVEIVVKEKNLLIYVRNKDLADRFALTGMAPTFEVLVGKILEEAAQRAAKKRSGDDEDEQQ